MPEQKYRRIAATLRAETASLAEGARLPSERELGSRFSVSPMTVRRALEDLEAEGRLIRVAGRGTFVQRSVISKGDVISSFTADMVSRALTPSTRLLGVEFVRADAQIARDLKLREGDRVLAVERLRLADEEPMCVETAHLPARVGQLLVDADDNGFESLHASLFSVGFRITGGSRRIRATGLDDRRAMLLRQPAGAPTLAVTQVFHQERGKPLQRADSFYRADRYEVHSSLHEPASPLPYRTTPRKDTP